MKQDLSKKISIVVREDLPQWQILNTIAHISCYFGNRLAEKFGTGEFFHTKDGVKHPRNTQHPIIVLGAEKDQLKKLMSEVRESGLEYIGFLNEMIDMTDDEAIQKALSEKEDKDVEYLGIGAFGDKNKIKELTQQFSLWK